MNVDKINAAVENLKVGDYFRVDNLTLATLNPKCISVLGFPTYIYIENITKTIALEELENIKRQFKEMIDLSDNLLEFLRNKEVIYTLGYNYGMGSIGICEEKDGIIKWLYELED